MDNRDRDCDKSFAVPASALGTATQNDNLHRQGTAVAGSEDLEYVSR